MVLEEVAAALPVAAVVLPVEEVVVAVAEVCSSSYPPSGAIGRHRPMNQQFSCSLDIASTGARTLKLQCRRLSYSVPCDERQANTISSSSSGGLGSGGRGRGGPRGGGRGAPARGRGGPRGGGRGGAKGARGGAKVIIVCLFSGWERLIGLDTNTGMCRSLTVTPVSSLPVVVRKICLSPRT